jgi:pyruvate formate lyase activating enzyme
MKIGALQKVSLIDYPGKVCSVIFTQGCNFRCGYCHNPQLVLPVLFSSSISEEIIFNHLVKRKNKIEAVVISGGEPTIQNDLPDFIQKIKALKFFVKLDTNGSNPQMLKILFDEKLVDYIAMDVKTTFDKYDEVCGVKVNEGDISKSINLIKNSCIEKQFRITLVKSIHTPHDLIEIKKLINNKITMQFFNYTGKHVSPSFASGRIFNEDETKYFI